MNIYGIQFSCGRKIPIYKRVKDRIYFGVPTGIKIGDTEIKITFKSINVYLIDTRETYIKSGYISSSNRWTFINIIEYDSR